MAKSKLPALMLASEVEKALVAKGWAVQMSFLNDGPITANRQTTWTTIAPLGTVCGEAVYPATKVRRMAGQPKRKRKKLENLHLAD